MATVTTTTRDWKSLVLEHEKDYNKPEDVYRFSNGREFKNTDKQGGGPYA